MKRFMPFTPLHDALTRAGYACFWESVNEWSKRRTPEDKSPEQRFCFLPKPTAEFNGGQVGGLALYGFMRRAEKKRQSLSTEALPMVETRTLIEGVAS